MSETTHSDFARDARLAAIYRASAEDMPPPVLDAAILAAARREVSSRPRPAGVSFARSWRGALSIAAVVVLSVSLVTLMREEAPEVVSPAGEEALPADSKLKSSIAENNDEAGGEPRRGRETETPKSLGLKPSHSMSSSGLVMPQPDFRGPRVQTSKDASVGRAEPAARGALAPAKRRDGFAADVDSRNNRAVELKPQRPLAQPDAPQEFAQAPAAPKPVELTADKQAPTPAAVSGIVAGKNAPAKSAVADTERERDSSQSAPDSLQGARTKKELGNQSAPAVTSSNAMPTPRLAAPSAPATATKLDSNVDVTPEKWLERIEELRKQGRLDEAKSSLTEFIKRYPGYRLPDSLRDGIK